MPDFGKDLMLQLGSTRRRSEFSDVAEVTKIKGPEEGDWHGDHGTLRMDARIIDRKAAYRLCRSGAIRSWRVVLSDKETRIEFKGALVSIPVWFGSSDSVNEAIFIRVSGQIKLIEVAAS